MDSGQIYRVYQNQAAADLSLDFFIFLSLQFSNIKIFRHTFLRNCEAWKVDTWYTHGQWADVSCIPESGCCCLFVLFISSFFFLSNFQTLKFFVTLFSGTVRPGRLILGTHMDSGHMYRVYRNQAAALICPFISSFFFLSNFQTLIFFVTLFSGTVTPRRLKLGTHMDSGQMYSVYPNQAAASYLSLFSSVFFLSSFH